MKPKAPVRSAWMQAWQKQAFISAVLRRICTLGNDTLVLYMSVKKRILVLLNVIGASFSVGVT